MDQTWPPSAGSAADTDRLLSRVGELRSLLDSLAPRTEADRKRTLEALDAAENASERIRVLEKLLAESRTREEELTSAVVRESGAAADLQAQLAVAAGTLARSTSAESQLNDAQSRAAAAERRADMLAGELRLRVADANELRERCDRLENDLRAVTAQIAESAAESLRVGRLQEELELARRDAEDQRREAVSSGLKVVEAGATIEALESRIEGMHARILSLSTSSEPEPEAVVDLTEKTNAPEPFRRTDGGGWG
jgi:chromosome segregation ATPase